MKPLSVFLQSSGSFPAHENSLSSVNSLARSSYHIPRAHNGEICACDAGQKWQQKTLRTIQSAAMWSRVRESNPPSQLGKLE